MIFNSKTITHTHIQDVTQKSWKTKGEIKQSYF